MLTWNLRCCSWTRCLVRARVGVRARARARARVRVRVRVRVIAGRAARYARAAPRAAARWGDIGEI